MSLKTKHGPFSQAGRRTGLARLQLGQASLDRLAESDHVGPRWSAMSMPSKQLAADARSARQRVVTAQGGDELANVFRNVRPRGASRDGSTTSRKGGSLSSVRQRQSLALTMTRAERQSRQPPHRHAQRSRSTLTSFGFLTERRRTPS